MEYNLTTRSYIKIVMHSLKYSHSTVNGLILTEKKKPKDGSSGHCLEIADVIPLFHLGHGLTPMLEVALLQVSNYCKEKKLSIGGYYQANRYFFDSYPDVFAQKIAEKIYEQNNDAVLLMVHNFGLASAVTEESDAETALHLYQYNDTKWKQRPGSLRLDRPELAFNALNEFIYKSQHHLDLVDFDNHLDDITNDWTNKSLNTVVEDWVKTCV